MFNISLYKRHQ